MAGLDGEGGRWDEFDIAAEAFQEMVEEQKESLKGVLEEEVMELNQVRCHSNFPVPSTRINTFCRHSQPLHLTPSIWTPTDFALLHPCVTTLSLFLRIAQHRRLTSSERDGAHSSPKR